MTRRRAAFKVILACLSVVLTLTLVEATSFLFGTFEGPGQPVRGGNIRIYGQYDPDLFWSLRPFAETPNGERWINSDGLRGPAIGPKGETEYRILNLGESTTFAAQVKYEESYSARLETLLNREERHHRVKVLNAGVPGYSLFQGVQFLRLRGLRFKPDMVTLYFGFNDFLPIAFTDQKVLGDNSNQNGLTDRQLFKRRATPRARLLALLNRHSNAFRGLHHAFAPRAEPTVLTADRPRVPREDRRKLLHQARAICRRNGIELVLIVPIYRSFSDHEPLLRQYIDHYGLTHVDLPAVLPGRFTQPRRAYFVDGAHPTAEGHRLIAQAIHEVVSPLIR